MKHLFLFLFMLVMTTSMSAQIKVDKAGNYYAAKAASIDTVTGKTFTDSKGVSYPVFKSPRNAVYVWKTAKKGNKYKMYLITK